ncbi:hypothetical protein WJX73_002531 [Symbiochloris irregularis]|uniref:Uncharacterized protein n=1 Tax=Symbiochloris irregularis TaxID=706552 RepID=A0AAW1NXE0_9CHLO
MLHIRRAAARGASLCSHRCCKANLLLAVSAAQVIAVLFWLQPLAPQVPPSILLATLLQCKAVLPAALQDEGRLTLRKACNISS